MSFYEGSCLIDFERFLVRVFTKVKDERFNFRNVLFRRDDEPTHQEDLSVVVSVPLEDGMELESLSPDNFLFVYHSRVSFYHAHDYPGNLVKRTAVFDSTKLSDEEIYWILDYDGGALQVTELKVRQRYVDLHTGDNSFVKPENYYPQSAQLWFRDAKEEARYLSEDDTHVFFTSELVGSQRFLFKWLEESRSFTTPFSPSERYWDIIPGVLIESSEFLEAGDRVLMRLTPNDDPVYEVFGGLIKTKVRLYVDPLSEVQAKRIVGNLFSLVLSVQQKLKEFDIPVNNIRCRSNTEEADVGRDRSKKVFVEFETQFQYEIYHPIQRYLRDIRFESVSVVEASPVSVFSKGDSL